MSKSNFFKKNEADLNPQYLFDIYDSENLYFTKFIMHKIRRIAPQTIKIVNFIEKNLRDYKNSHIFDKDCNLSHLNLISERGKYE
jgi:hypothetical protein